MQVEILGTESLGVRGLACAVQTREKHVIIDPGVALGYRREGLLPHPRQVAAGETVARRIVRHLAVATDVVFSHFHGDHIPLAAANPFQLSLPEVAPLLRRPRLWAKDPADESDTFVQRSRDIARAAGQSLRFDPDCRAEGIVFSAPMPHGAEDAGPGTVMMTRIEDDGEVFVHASDIQLLEDAPVAVILDWRPTLLLVSGPPLYRQLSSEQMAAARKRILQLVRMVPVCIIDHHLLRSRPGMAWLDGLKRETDGAVQCAADYMQVPRCLLEADRTRLYMDWPVAPDWHNRYHRPALPVFGETVGPESRER